MTFDIQMVDIGMLVIFVTWILGIVLLVPIWLIVVWLNHNARHDTPVHNVYRILRVYTDITSIMLALMAMIWAILSLRRLL